MEGCGAHRDVSLFSGRLVAPLAWLGAPRRLCAALGETPAPAARGHAADRRRNASMVHAWLRVDGFACKDLNITNSTGCGKQAMRNMPCRLHASATYGCKNLPFQACRFNGLIGRTCRKKKSEESGQIILSMRRRAPRDSSGKFRGRSRSTRPSEMRRGRSPSRS
eukprot:5287884-Pleurochrysis_carterae.AAC.1